MTLNFEPIRSLIGRHEGFVLTTHVNPDGDGLGSELALSWFLRKLGKRTTVINHSETPAHYSWLDPRKEIFHFSQSRDSEIILNAEVIVVVDTNHRERLRSMQETVLNSRATKVIIDHHLEPDNFAQHYLIDDDATSTGEIVYRLMKEMGPDNIDADIAGALYTAIMTDTGSFRYPRTDPDIHAIVAELIRKGADPTETYTRVYETWSPGRMKLLGEMIESIITAFDGRLAYAVCTQEMFKQTGTTEVETDNFTTYPMSINGVVVGILFNELPNGVKISFRSRGDIPINELAKEFGGNGHRNAAGARLYNVKLDETIRDVLGKSKKYLSP